MSYTYQIADSKLTGRCKDSRKLENNTYLQRRGKDIAVRFHATDIVTFHPNGDITLNTGGWNTVTTKARINNYSPYSVSSERGTLFMFKTGDWNSKVPFADGMTIKADGKVTGVTETIEDIKAEWRKTDRENARISRWKSKARGLTRDKTGCTERYCWQCHPKPFRSPRGKIGTCDCGCVISYTPPVCPKLTVAKIEAEENRTVKTAMILCYGLVRFLNDAGKIVEVTALTPEFKTEDIRTFLRYSIDSWHHLAGMKDAEGNIILVDGNCRNLKDAREWYARTAANALVNRGLGSPEDIIRTEMLRSL